MVKKIRLVGEKYVFSDFAGKCVLFFLFTVKLEIGR